jgi:cytochrome c oxidase subunit 4
MTQENESEGAGGAGPEADAGRDEHGENGDGAHEDHGKAYLAVWGGLAVLTVAEIWVASLGWPKTLIVVLLVGMAIWKAGLVALYYMHLKFEPRRVWILAASPLPLAVILVMVVLQEF